MALMLSFQLNAQLMKTPAGAVTQLFVATDEHNWELVETIFANEVKLDYSSMTGDAATMLSPTQITTAWKGVLPGFETTHHQLGNFIVTEKDNTAHVFCYGTAYHYLADEAGNSWTVVGTYDFDLVKTSKANWTITHMTFNFKFQDGNTSLPAKAIAQLKNK